MLAAPISLPANSSNGPRPINLREDADSILKLLDITFGPLQDERGRRQIGDRVFINLNPPLLYRLTTFPGRFRPGFVWVEDGQIIANVTLVKSQITGRYLIANVAVLPEYRRMGFGRRLLEETIQYIYHLNGRDIILQVRQENSAAIQLYESLGFSRLGAMKHWETTTSRLRSRPAEDNMAWTVRKLKSREWGHAYALDIDSINPDLTWPMPTTRQKYNRSLFSKIDNFLNAQNNETWVVEKLDSNNWGTNLAGLVNLKSEWRRPLRIELRVHPKARGRIEHILLNKGLDRLSSWRGGTIRMTHPAEDEIVNVLLSGSNFTKRETLLVMQLVLT